MKLNIESEKFDIPSLEKVAESLNIGLKENYKDVNVQVVDCPNLKLWVVLLRVFLEMRK